jgi:hypothetical protein
MTHPLHNPLALMHRTPNGGWAVNTGRELEFESIPCRLTINKRKHTDTYYFKGGIKLRRTWDNEEFELV